MKKLLSTADVWVNSDAPPYFSYEYIEEGIEDCREILMILSFAKKMIFLSIFEDSKRTVVRISGKLFTDWQRLCAAGVVFFGIKEKELVLENPPVYMLHEADELKDWKLFAHTLSEYLMCVCYWMLLLE